MEIFLEKNNWSLINQQNNKWKFFLESYIGCPCWVVLRYFLFLSVLFHCVSMFQWVFVAECKNVQGHPTWHFREKFHAISTPGLWDLVKYEGEKSLRNITGKRKNILHLVSPTYNFITYILHINHHIISFGSNTPDTIMIRLWGNLTIRWGYFPGLSLCGFCTDLSTRLVKIWSSQVPCGMHPQNQQSWIISHWLLLHEI